jgi:uncharacterized membrane protein
MLDTYNMAVAVLTGLGQLVAITAAAVLGAWAVGGVVLRLGGAGLVIAGLGAAALAHPAGLLVALLGAALWTAGHWLYTLRHHAYKSPLARRLFLQLLPARCDPARRWATPTTTTRTTP